MNSLLGTGTTSTPCRSCLHARSKGSQSQAAAKQAQFGLSSLSVALAAIVAPHAPAQASAATTPAHSQLPHSKSSSKGSNAPQLDGSSSSSSTNTRAAARSHCSSTPDTGTMAAHTATSHAHSATATTLPCDTSSNPLQEPLKKVASFTLRSLASAYARLTKLKLSGVYDAGV